MHGRQRGAVDVFDLRHRRSGFDRGDADDRALQALDVGADALGEVGQRRLGAELAAQLFAGGFELAADAAHATRPGIAAERVDHRAADAPFGKRLELDAATLVEAVGGIDQADHAVLNEVTEVDGVGHGGRHAPGQGFDKWQTRSHAFLLMYCQWDSLHH